MLFCSFSHEIEWQEIYLHCATRNGKAHLSLSTTYRLDAGLPAPVTRGQNKPQIKK